MCGASFPVIRRWASCGLLVLALGMFGACEIDGSIGRNDPDGEGTVGAGGSGAQLDGSETGPTTASGTASAGGGSGGGTGSDGADTRDTDVSDMPAACNPTPDDNACAACRKVNCCGFLHECLAHDSCLCWWECAATDQNAQQCAMLCGTDGVQYMNLVMCAQDNCDACPAA